MHKQNIGCFYPLGYLGCELYVMSFLHLSGWSGNHLSGRVSISGCRTRLGLKRGGEVRFSDHEFFFTIEAPRDVRSGL